MDNDTVISISEDENEDDDDSDSVDDDDWNDEEVMQRVIQLSKLESAGTGGENSKDGVDVGAEDGDARQEIVQLVGFVEGVRQLLDLRIKFLVLSGPVSVSCLSCYIFTWTKAPMLATIAKVRITISAP